MDIFKPTKDQIEDALSGGIPRWESGTEVHMIVTDIEEKEQDDGLLLIIECEVLNTKHKGKKVKHFIRTWNPAAARQFYDMVQAFVDQDAMVLLGQSGELKTFLIGKSLGGQTDNYTAASGKVYTNYKNWTAIEGSGGSAPDLDSSDIPF